MMPAAKAFDPVLGVDIHIIQPPGPVPPLPIPHPFIGFLFDPVDFIPFVGATVKVNGLPRATAGTGAKGMPPHIPMGGVFVAPPSNDGEMFMGSSTVLMDGDPASHLALPALTCQSIGMPSPPRAKAKTKPKSFVLPTSVVLPIPAGMPVLVGGPPTISMMALGMKLAFAGLARLASSRLGQRLRRGFAKLRQRACRNMRPGFLKCILLRAEPVHVVTGEVVVEQEDFALPWRVPLRWTRRYGSQQTRYGVCGRGWETPADARLEFEPDGSVTFRDGSAGASVFTAVPEVGAEPERELVAGALLGRMRDDEGIEWLVVRTRAGLRYWFAVPPWDVRELPVSHVMDGCDNWTQYLHGPDGLVEVRDSSGQRIVAESRGGRLLRLDLVDPGTGALLPLVAYEYGSASHAVDDLTAVIDALGAPYRFAYDGDRRLVRHTDRTGLSFHYAYAPAPGAPAHDARCVHAWGDGGLYAYHFAWEDDGVAGVGHAHVRDSLGHTSTIEYDLVTLLPMREVDPLGGVTTWEYDAAGRCAAEVKPDGARTEWEYDAAGAVVRETAPDGATTRTEYDAEGRPAATVDPLGNRWAQEWDARGLPARRVGPRGGEWRYEHDARGDVVAVTDPLGHTTHLVHDAFGGVREIVDPLGHVTRFEIDARGATTARVDPLGFRSAYAYDPKGRLVRAVDPMGHATVCEYDAEDRPRRLRDAAGHVTELVHAGLGELVTRRNPDGTRVRYRYDTEERLLGVENERGQRYTLERDALGRVMRATDYWGQTTEYRHAGAGPLAASVDALGRTTAYAFDAAGRLARAAYEDGTADEFTYDLAGHLVLAANAAATVTFRRDAESNVVEERQGGARVESEYDLLGRRVVRRSSAGHEVRFAYDARGLPSEVELDGEVLVQTHRDARGLPEAESLLGGMQRTFAWDAAGRLTKQRLLRGPGTVAARAYRYDTVGQLVERRSGRDGPERYTYDPLGRITEEVDPAGRLERFAYDPAGDLLADVTPTAGAGARPSPRVARGAGATYEFDAVGNLARRVRADGAEAQFRWDGANRLVEATTEAGEIVTFRYDALGRRTEKRVGDRVTAFAWDGDRLLADVHDPKHPREFVYRPGAWEVLASANGRVCHYENDQVGLPRTVVTQTGESVWAASYDALGGAVRVDNAAYDNPIRCQGQYHDSETGLSYNRFRYYDPACGAFVTKDPLARDAGPNLYWYAPNVWGWVDLFGLTCAPGGRRLWNGAGEGTDRVLEATTGAGRNKYFRHAETGLYWSRDTAGHGGSVWKVFREEADGLHWTADADKFGDFITGKHKGDVGRFIPRNRLTPVG